MLSETYTGTNLRPLCTAMVLPTISGKMVDRRDQVLMTFFSIDLFCSSTFLSRWPSMNGPFEVDLAIKSYFRLFTIMDCVRLLRRVL